MDREDKLMLIVLIMIPGLPSIGGAAYFYLNWQLDEATKPLIDGMDCKELLSLAFDEDHPTSDYAEEKYLTRCAK